MLNLVPLLLSNWKAIAIAVFVVSVMGFMYLVGYHNGQTHWQRKADTERAELQKKADDAAAEYEAGRAALEEKLKTAKGKRYASKNIDYVNCHADPEFLRDYRAVSGKSPR